MSSKYTNSLSSSTIWLMKQAFSTFFFRKWPFRFFKYQFINHIFQKKVKTKQKLWLWKSIKLHEFPFYQTPFSKSFYWKNLNNWRFESWISVLLIYFEKPWLQKITIIQWKSLLFPLISDKAFSLVFWGG